MAVTQFLAAAACASPVALNLLGGQVVEVRYYHAQVGGLEQFPIVLKHALRAVFPLAEWPGLSLLHHALREKKTVERPGEEPQQRCAYRPETPTLVRNKHASGSVSGIDVAVLTARDASARLPDDWKS